MIKSGKSNTDTVYAAAMNSVSAFRFDESVADVFQDMIERSVPGYGLILELIGVLSEKYAQPRTNCYDLGCSLGASTLQLKRHIPSDCTVIGIDNSEAMVTRCIKSMERDRSGANFDIRLEDLRESQIQNASIVVLNFTLQFVPDEERQAILTRIAEGMNPGGILLLAEKIKFEDPARQEFLTELHHSFKKHQGYSDLEVSQKRSAIENVLIPNTESQHIERLHKAGFVQTEVCIRCLNFEAILGIKPTA